MEKKALVFFALFTALRERRVTPREVSIVDDGDGEKWKWWCRELANAGQRVILSFQAPFNLRYPGFSRPQPAIRQIVDSQPPLLHAAVFDGT